MKYCRFCKSDGNLVHLLTLDKFPSSAQGFTFKDYKKDSGTDIDVFQCVCCSLIQIGSSPVPYYKDVITAASMTSEQIKTTENEILSLLRRPVTVQQALEVGSGKGSFLRVLSALGKKFGFDATGLENNPDSVSVASELEINIELGYLCDPSCPILSKKFDLIFVNNFLEHQPDPKIFLKNLYSIGSAEALVYVSVPNFNRMFETGCLHEFIPDHLLYFNDTSLNNILKNSGFEILDTYLKNDDNDIVVVAKKKKPINLSSAVEKFESIKESVTVKINSLKNKRVAVWGAGHRALAFMSQCKLDDLVCVIDSASFKQGKMTPILGHAVISPEDALNSNLDSIFLMLPATYNNEARSFLERHNFNGEIIDFRDQPI